MSKIFINPGHSLNCIPDPGAVANGYKEAEQVAKIAIKLAELLEANNFECQTYQQAGNTLTANQQLNVAISMANASKADVLVSIHMNAASESAKGIETFYCQGSTNGKRLAEYVNAALTKAYVNYTFVNRGVKSDNLSAVGSLGILRKTSPVACLVELGFITNRAEADFVNSHIAEIAERICIGICDYFGVKYRVVIKDEQPVKIRVEKDSDGLYNCYINDILKLKGNRFTSITEWLNKQYGV